MPAVSRSVIPYAKPRLRMSNWYLNRTVLSPRLAPPGTKGSKARRLEKTELSRRRLKPAATSSAFPWGPHRSLVGKKKRFCSVTRDRPFGRTKASSARATPEESRQDKRTIAQSRGNAFISRISSLASMPMPRRPAASDEMRDYSPRGSGSSVSMPIPRSVTRRTRPTKRSSRAPPSRISRRYDLPTSSGPAEPDTTPRP